MWASNKGHVATVQALLEAGADRNVRNKVLAAQTPTCESKLPALDHCKHYRRTIKLLQSVPRIKKSGH
jgi:ankyrin repeat protein